MPALHQDPRLAEAGIERRVDAGTAVFEVGDPVDAVHIVLDGVVLVRTVSIDGDSAVVDVRGRGDLLDDTALLDRAPTLHYDAAVAITAARVLRLSRRAFDELRDRSPEVGAALIVQLTEQVRRLSGAVVDLLGCPGRTRAARRLLAIADALHRSDMEGQVLALTQQDIADFVGTTRSTLNAYVQEFEDARALRTGRGRLTIIDRRALERFA